METFLLWKEKAALPTQPITLWTQETLRNRKKLTTKSGLRADMSGEEVAECIELSTDKMEGGREDEEELEEEEEEELSSLSTCCSECTVMKSTCCTMAGWVRQEEEE